MSPETVSMQKLVLAESERFPELAATFHASGIGRAHELLSDHLRAQRDRGLLALADPDMAAGMLRGMMVEPQRAMLMGQAPFPTAGEIAARARACVALFLNGCQTSPTPRR